MKATKTNQPDAWTVYDALGNRVGTKINDVWQLMVYDAFGKLVAEYGVAAETVGGVKYIQQDWQGSVRAVTNSNGFVVARTDHQAYGEDIGIGVGLRGVEQGYSADKATRQGYGLTENDNATGQQHTWFRKLETQAGRWSSPDPYKGSMNLSNPQSFNRYSYVENQPTNFVDPSGLVRWGMCILVTWEGRESLFCSPQNDRAVGSAGGPGTSSSGRGGSKPQQDKPCPISDLTPLTGEALNMENGQKVIFDKVNQATLNALTCLQESILEVSGTGGPHTSGSTGIGGQVVSFDVESAYRPDEYQRHFWEILDKLKDKRINQKNCSSLKANLIREKDEHGLKGIAAKSNSNHSNGTGVDMTWKGISASKVDQKASNCGLIRNLKHVPGERSHFTLK
ncbi:MAG: RHS repeat domain-containing protein [Blastocatellia bacterium]